MYLKTGELYEDNEKEWFDENQARLVYKDPRNAYVFDATLNNYRIEDQSYAYLLYSVAIEDEYNIMRQDFRELVEFEAYNLVHNAGIDDATGQTKKSPEWGDFEIATRKADAWLHIKEGRQ